MSVRRILVVEDEAQMAHVLAAIVRPYCSEVAIVGTLQSALACVRSRDISIVLLDLALPDSRPRETLDAVLKFKGAGVTKVFIVTGSGGGDTLDRAIAASGADGAVYKTDPDFVRVIEAVVW